MKAKTVCVCVLLLTVLALALQSQPTRGQGAYQKTLIIAPQFFFNETSAPAPSFSTLQSGGFTTVGTIAYASWTPGQEWAETQTWIQSVKAAGFKAAIDLCTTSGDQILNMTEEAATIGADVVFLDEIISQYPSYVTESVLQSIILAGRSINPNLQYYINEWNETYLDDAYAWTVNYPYVQVADDNYNTESVIDYNINLASQYAKTPAAWLIFAQGTQDFQCYEDFSSWLAYAQTKQEDTLFWYVDPNQTYVTDWPLVLAFTLSTTTTSTDCTQNCTQTVGGSSSEGGDVSGSFEGVQLTPVVNMVVTSVGINVAASSGYAYVGVYSDSSGSPSSLLASSNQATLSSGWNSIALTSPVSLTTGTPYWIAFHTDINSYPSIYYGTSGTSDYAYASYGPLPSTFGTATTQSDVQWNLQVTYTVSTISTSTTTGSSSTTATSTQATTMTSSTSTSTTSTQATTVTSSTTTTSTSSTTVSANNAPSQVTMTVSYSVVGGGRPTAPVFSYVSNGVSKSLTLSKTGQAVSVDTGSTWSVTPNPLGGSGSSQQWISNQALTGTASASTIVFSFQHQYYLTMNVNGPGSVTVSSGWYNAGQRVTIKATPNSGHKFKSWTGTGAGSYTGISASHTITMNAAITETANFT